MCSACRWSRSTAGGLECHRLPPSLPGPVRWPVVAADDWCADARLIPPAAVAAKREDEPPPSELKVWT